MPEHGTALSEGQMAEFVGAGTKALILIANLLGPDLTQNWARNGKALERAILSALMPPEGKPASLLEPLGTVEVPGLPRFVALEKFVLNYGNEAKPGVRIAWLSNNFTSLFLDKIEEPVAEAAIRYANLTRPSTDGPIRDEIGDNAEITLSQFFALLERQPNGESGALLTNGWANIAYIRDVKGQLREVCATWYVVGGGWYVDVSPVEGPGAWDVGYRVLSRNSLGTGLV